jgi:hypothetical protein
MTTSFEPFQGDVEELEQMALISYRDEYKLESYNNNYSPQRFDYLFGGLPQRDHLLAAYDDGKLTAFTALVPRRYHFRGEIYRALLGCLMVTRKEAFRHGLAIGLGMKALELFEKYHYDFALAFLDSGHRSSQMIAKLRAAGNHIHKVKRMAAIFRALDLGQVFAFQELKGHERAAMKLFKLDKLDAKSPPAAVRPYDPRDLTSCHELLDSYRNKVTLTRVFEPDELARELSYPEVAHTLVWEEAGKIRGLVNWVLIDHVGKITQPWAWLNHIYWDGLNGKEQSERVRAFLLKAREQGAAAVLEWFKNYYPKMPLWKNRFVPIPRYLDVIAGVFNPNLDLTDIPDMFEIML